MPHFTEIETQGDALVVALGDLTTGATELSTEQSEFAALQVARDVIIAATLLLPWPTLNSDGTNAAVGIGPGPGCTHVLTRQEGLGGGPATITLTEIATEMNSS